MKHFFQKLLVLLVLAASFSSARADHVICRVLDAETHEPLAQAVVKCCHETDQLVHNVYTTTDSLGYIRHASCTDNQGNIWSTSITISYVGYHPAEINFVQSDSKKDTIRLADVLLRPSAIMLREATVKAQQKFFTMRGDTVVFHPGAFHLEEGERLTELIKQLPGVAVDKSGALTWNGRPIRLRMNGEEGMSESLLGQLPISAVKDIKAYEKLTELSERTGKDDGNGEQVLDITIKPGFLDKWYGSVEAKGYTTGNYGGKTDAHYLSKDRPFMVMASASDGTEHLWTSAAGYRGRTGGNTDFHKQQYGELCYAPKWTPDFEGWKERNSLMINANPTHYDHTAESEISTTDYLEGAPSTHTDSRTTNDDHTIELPLYANTHLNLSPKTTLWLTVGGRYERSDKRTHTESETIDVNTATTHQSVHDESGSGMARAILTHYVKDGSLKGEVQANYAQGTSQSEYVANYHYFKDGVSTPLPSGEGPGVGLDLQTFSAPHRNLSTSLNLAYEQWLGEHLELTAGYSFSYNNTTRDEERQRGGEYDAANSFSRHRQLADNALNFGLTYSIGNWMFKPALNLTMQHERMAYQRGVLDTVAVRNVVMPTPSFSIRFKTSKFSFLQLKADYRTSQPDLISTLAYTDDTNVLYVREGNPALHASHTLNASANYSVSIPRTQQMFSIKMEYKKDFDAIGSVSTYNPTTGAYRTHDENMRGGSSLYFNVLHNCVLFKHLRWHHGVTLESNDSYGVLTTIEGSTSSSSVSQNFPPVGGTEGGFSRQRANSVHYGSTWTFDLQPVKITLEGAAGYTADRYKGADASSLLSVPSQDLWNYDLSLNAEYKWRAFTFSLLPSFAGHKGYNSARMNRDRFVLGADVMWKFLKGRASLDLRADDIFNNSDVVWSSESATQITESWTKNLHHYLLLTFRLHFDARGEKK